LETIGHAQGAGISVCSGGIIGLGETNEDRVGMLHTLSTLSQHPESVPINALLAVEGTPLEKQEVRPPKKKKNKRRVWLGIWSNEVTFHAKSFSPCLSSK
jgi:biotin synthase-like enzyme